MMSAFGPEAAISQLVGMAADRSTPPMFKPSLGIQFNRGFTLIELICVIVILGILAAAALPKFIDLGKDARSSVIYSTKGAVSSAVGLALGKCTVTSGCFVANWSTPVSGPNGVVGTMYNGYPTGQSRVPSYFGIKDWVNVSGVSVYEVNTAVTEFRVDTAPDPTNCKVVYHQVDTFGLSPSVTTAVSGC